MKSIIGTRDEQQDFACLRLDDKKVFAVVCDGMGGHQNGGLASFTASETLLELYERKDPLEPYSVFFQNVVHVLDENVYGLKNDRGKKLGAGTTLVAAAVEGDELTWLSVGDSRLYILRKNECVQVTRDHNYLLELERLKQEKKITESKYEKELSKGESLISFVGMGGISIHDINLKPFVLSPQDTLLLSTDGLHGTLTKDEILLCLNQSDAQEAARELLDKVESKENKYQDNTTFIVIKYEGSSNEAH